MSVRKMGRCFVLPTGLVFTLIRYMCPDGQSPPLAESVVPRCHPILRLGPDLPPISVNKYVHPRTVWRKQ
ncbi:unnamed protein product [Protopolystoma xenopodis]|uniref:Secreted protein n=1 Tax=Protopolystoma xenopodis TaxID=117903 RepID=A0A3S5C5C8_9PLAT|nr:unnamed protein product [Protopolystoma xenopodis]